MKVTRYTAHIKENVNAPVKSYPVFWDKKEGLLVKIGSSYVSIEAAENIFEMFTLTKKKQKIRDNSLLDWARSLLLVGGFIMLISLPSALVNII